MAQVTIKREPEDGDEIVHVHGYRALRQTARDWTQFSNDALGRIQIPAEDKTRTFRQYPIETDPPVHTAYRALVQDMFNKPFDPAYAALIEALVDQMVADALDQGEVEIVERFCPAAAIAGADPSSGYADVRGRFVDRLGPACLSRRTRL